ncbi:MAG: acyl-CoA dehydrogenase family protein [Acidimicrobiales bacterium]
MADVTSTTRLESPPYRAPVAEISLALDSVGLEQLLSLKPFAEIDRVAIDDALAEFGRFASEVIAPTDRRGDVEGSRLSTASGAVVTPAGFADVYQRFAQGGWSALQFPAEFGGAGLPAVVGLAISEMFASANLSLSLVPVLTQSGIELLLSWATDDQRATYLPNLLSGRWTATMNLTEAEAGSDLAEVRTVARPDGEGRWRLYGTKIFITWGEHDLAENIIHLVLARTPDAPVGTKGLSLFVVPKLTVDEQGNLGEQNALRCERLEEKLGLHGSPTCVMSYDGALGELVGAEHSGLAAMFTMMNVARIAIGVEGPAVAERACQQAEQYARDRLQGRALGDDATKRSAIIDHPDVRRMLLSMRTLAIAGRLLTYDAMVQRDLARHGETSSDRQRAQQLCDLLTPIAKAWSTDAGCSAASLGIQVLGGAGYIDESGMGQRLRDIRIGPIYEGTNGIQAIDLVVRKVGRDQGATVERVIASLRSLASEHAHSPGALAVSFQAVAQATETFASTTRWMLGHLGGDANDALAGATSYLELAALTLAGAAMIRRACHAQNTPLTERAIDDSNFFATEFVAKTAGLVLPITAGAGRLALN